MIDVKLEKQSDNEDSIEVKQVIQSECELQQLHEPVLSHDMIDEYNGNETINPNDLKAVESNLNIDKGDGFPVEIKATNLKRKTDHDEAEASSSKHSRLERCPTNPLNVEVSSSHQKPSNEDKEIVDKESARKRAKNKNKISKLVMLFLNRKYSNNKIAGEDPKALYKKMARQITHMFYDINPDIVPKTKEVERYIETVFVNHEIVTSLKDLDNI